MPIPLPPEWQITAAYLGLIWAAMIGMKLLSIAADPAPMRDQLAFFFLSPTFSTTTWRISAANLRLPAGAACLAGMTTYHFWMLPLLQRGALAPALLAYAAAIPLWLLVGCFGLAGQLAGLIFRRRLESIHDRVFATRSLSEFWGRRWNRWIGAWLRQICFQPLRHRPVLGVLAAFGASAALHELVAAVPLWLVYGRNTFGMMTAYFLFQGVGVLIERRWLPRPSTASRILAWVWILAPLPLVLNEAARRIFHFA